MFLHVLCWPVPGGGMPGPGLGTYSGVYEYRRYVSNLEKDFKEVNNWNVRRHPSKLHLGGVRPSNAIYARTAAAAVVPSAPFESRCKQLSRTTLTY